MYSRPMLVSPMTPWFRDGHGEIDLVAVEGDLRRQDVAGEGDDRKGQKRRARGDDRRHDKQDLVGSRRREVLFEQQLEGVGQGLEQPPGAYPVGAVPQLDETQDLAFQEHRIGDAGEQDPHHHGDLEDADSY